MGLHLGEEVTIRVVERGREVAGIREVDFRPRTPPHAGIRHQVAGIPLEAVRRRDVGDHEGWHVGDICHPELIGPRSSKILLGD